MTNSEAVKKLRAYLKCKAMEVKGIYEDCNNKRCDDCDLCYMQGTTGEHMTAIGIAIQALEKQKHLYNDSVDKKVYYEDIYVIGEYKDITIYLIHDNGKRIYEHALKPFESFNTLNETIYDIEVTLLNNRFGRG